MVERYNYRLDKDKTFFAGYLLCVLKGDYHEPSLFSSLRIVRVTDGSAVLRIDNKEYTLNPGDVVTLNNLVPRQFVKVHSPEFRFEVFAFSPLILKRESICMSLFYSRPNIFYPVISKECEAARDLHMLLDVLRNKISSTEETELKHNVVSNLIISVATCILDINRHSSSDGNLYESGINELSVGFVADAIQYIFSNMSEPITVSDMAKRVNVSREYFSRMFRKIVGYTPSEFINHCKTDNVIHLVQYNNMKIIDAAMESGFNSASGFYSAFRSVHGTSPKHYFETN